MIDRLLKNLHPAINKDPQSSSAMSIQGSGTVIIKNDTLQIIGAQSAQFDLKGYTLGSLMSAINQISGFTATCLAPVNLGASVLIAGTYQLPSSLPMFNSFLWQLLKPVAIALLDALGAEGQAIQEMIINTSEGAWLDSFGEFFGVSRESGEPDSLYATRIFNLSVGMRNNNIAIQKALNDVEYGADVEDAGNAYFTINIQIPTDSPEGFIYTTDQIRNIVDQLRPAGVSYAILSQGSASDSVTLSESVTMTVITTAKYGARKWGQLIWA